MRDNPKKVCCDSPEGCDPVHGKQWFKGFIPYFSLCCLLFFKIKRLLCLWSKGCQFKSWPWQDCVSYWVGSVMLYSVKNRCTVCHCTATTLTLNDHCHIQPFRSSVILAETEPNNQRDTKSCGSHSRAVQSEDNERANVKSSNQSSRHSLTQWFPKWSPLECGQIYCTAQSGEIALICDFIPFAQCEL